MRKSVLLGLGAIVAAAALFGGYYALSGGDSSPTAQASNIRVGNGLAVANISGSPNNKSTNGSVDSAAPAAETGGGGASSGNATSARPAGADGSLNSAPQQQAITNTGITVQGYGTASADADSAVVEFSFGNYGTPVPLPYPVEPNGGNGSSGAVKPDVAPSPTTVAAITKADLQPVIDALTGAGVAASDIEFLDQSYYDQYYASATLRATIKNIDSVDNAVSAAQTAAGSLSNGITLQGTNVSYTLQDCSALEKAAMQAAVEDAHSRATLLASALDVTLGTVSGASDYSYSPSGSPCSGGFYGPYPMAAMPYKIGSTGQGQVQVVSQLSLTYAFN